MVLMSAGFLLVLILPGRGGGDEDPKVVRDVVLRFDGANGLDPFNADGRPLPDGFLALPLGCSVKVEVLEAARERLVDLWQFTDRWTTTAKRGKTTITTYNRALPIQEQWVSLGKGVEIFAHWKGVDDGRPKDKTVELSKETLPYKFETVFPCELELVGVVSRNRSVRGEPPLSHAKPRRTGPVRIGPNVPKETWYTVRVTITR
jgi:hypothetical protein